MRTFALRVIVTKAEEKEQEGDEINPLLLGSQGGEAERKGKSKREEGMKKEESGRNTNPPPLLPFPSSSFLVKIWRMSLALPPPFSFFPPFHSF